MGRSIIYKKLNQDEDTKLKLDRIAIDLENHGRAIVKDPTALRLMSRKLQPLRQRNQVFISRDNVNKVSIISVSPNYKIVRTRQNRLKIFNTY